ncbi:MAG: tRNA (adenosine(37)-N6)-threonylcarbamoyltransferase complex dimerization subunit type 1 TsaB, partial [Brevundimonas sp.]
RRGQVYARLFRDGVAQGAAEALSLEAATDLILDVAAGTRPGLVGSGAAVLVETFPERLERAETAPLVAPSPDPAVALPAPLYLRAPDATPPSRLPGQARPPAAS